MGYQHWTVSPGEIMTTIQNFSRPVNNHDMAKLYPKYTSKQWSRKFYSMCQKGLLRKVAYNLYEVAKPEHSKKDLSPAKPRPEVEVRLAVHNRPGKFFAVYDTQTQKYEKLFPADVFAGMSTEGLTPHHEVHSFKLCERFQTMVRYHLIKKED